MLNDQQLQALVDGFNSLQMRVIKELPALEARIAALEAKPDISSLTREAIKDATEALAKIDQLTKDLKTVNDKVIAGSVTMTPPPATATSPWYKFW